MYSKIKVLLNRDIVKNILIENGYIVNKYYKFKIRPERTPSASIAPNGYIKDFGGDFNGDIFNFLVSNCNFNAKEALKYVANFVNYDTTPKYDFKTNLNEVATILSLGYQENKIKAKKDLNFLFGENFLAAFDMGKIEKFLGYCKKRQALAYIFKNDDNEVCAIAYNERKQGRKWIRHKGSKNSYIITNLLDDYNPIIIAEGVSEPLILELLDFGYICFQNANELAKASKNPQFIALKSKLKNKEIYIIADNDEIGYSSALELAKSLKCAQNVYITRFESPKKGFDLRDLILSVNSWAKTADSFEREIIAQIGANSIKVQYG